MTQIGASAAHHFENRRRFKLSNTEVKIVDDNPEMYLLGNKISWVRNGRLHWTMAGHPTKTTKDRLCFLLRGQLYQRNITQYYFGPGMDEAMEIDPHEVYVEDFR